MRVIDFFCGAGGFSEGFRQAGFDVIFAVDKWLPAVNTYRGNKPNARVIQDDIIRIANLDDSEFESLIPDSEIIIGSPPCQSFSNSNKSGNTDKTVGVRLIEAYLKIVARKKYKKNSILKYWILENVPAVKYYIKEKYTAKDLGLDGDFILEPHSISSGEYNAKYFGAPTNRKRYLCGEFPKPIKFVKDNNVVTLKMILDSLGAPLEEKNKKIVDINYPDLILKQQDLTDHHYVYELAKFEYETAKRLKQDRGYMGKMAFPENVDKPSRTVMATMSTSSREAMILSYKYDRYRLPTVREVASMMSFPIDYWFFGESKAVKHTLVGNAVPPKLSYAIAKAIAEKEHIKIPTKYPKIYHDNNLFFYNLNNRVFNIKQEKRRRNNAKFKYHIPYMIINSYRVELTNYNSDFLNNDYRWEVEIHRSQGKNAKIFIPIMNIQDIPRKYHKKIKNFMLSIQSHLPRRKYFQDIYCMTSEERKIQPFFGPFELLNEIKLFIDDNIESIDYDKDQCKFPLKILVGYYLLSNLIKNMEE